ncbi:hypothetical protein [Candidatus Ruminimicrobiellum ovillum]|uniref:hypothetical protein n=1 Tax=Candidatus Ruminimicrobiellum ovillum TaxID=1947927 RepID=UPI003559FA36
MNLNEITETGFYKAINDEKPTIIFEVIKNTDEEWLRDNPQAILLIDEWGYEYTDDDDRRHYETFGNLIQVQNADKIEVEKMTENFIISGRAGNCLTEDKPTYKEKFEQSQKENEELKSLCEKYGKINEQETKDYAELKEKYNKMVEISKENLIKYEDLRIDNQKLIMEIGGLKSQLDFEAQKQEILFKENVELKSYIKEDLVPHTKIYIQALEEIREIATDLKQTKIPYCQIEEQIQDIIIKVIGGKQCQQ